MINTKSMVKKPNAPEDSLKVFAKLNTPRPMLIIDPRKELHVHENPPMIPNVPNKVI